MCNFTREYKIFYPSTCTTVEHIRTRTDRRADACCSQNGFVKRGVFLAHLNETHRAIYHRYGRCIICVRDVCAYDCGARRNRSETL